MPITVRVRSPAAEGGDADTVLVLADTTTMIGLRGALVAGGLTAAAAQGRLIYGGRLLSHGAALVSDELGEVRVCGRVRG